MLNTETTAMISGQSIVTGKRRATCLRQR